MVGLDIQGHILAGLAQWAIVVIGVGVPVLVWLWGRCSTGRL